jgi:hypothetical protein
MKTLSEIEREERAVRDRAEQYQSLLGSAARLRTMVQRLTDQRINTTALEKIYALAGEVPASLVTRGTRFVAGGFIVRDMLITVTSAALADAQRKAGEIDTALAKAKTDLARVEAALAEFK